DKDGAQVADATITAVDGTTGAATISFTVVSGTADNTACTLVYPAKLSDGTTTVYNDEKTGVKDAATLLSAQDGTLNANLDVRVGAGTIRTTTPSLDVTTQPAAQFAIFKFTTKNSDASAHISVTALTITIGTQDYTVTPASATSEVYVALPAVSSQTVSFSAAGSDSKTYTCSKDGVTFAAAKFYQSTLKMAEAAAYKLLSAATAEDYGKVVCAAGHLHDAKTAVPAGCTAVGILGKVTETGHGLILALKNATAQTWNTINGWESVTTYAGTTLKVLPDDAARSKRLTSYTTLGETTVSNWAVAQKSDYEAIFQNLGSTINDRGYTYDDNVNAYITTGVGGSAISGDYWSATEDDDENAWYFYSEYWFHKYKTSNNRVRPVLGFGGDAAPAYTMAASATASDKDKLICTDGHIHAYGADAACTKNRVAKIIYVGTTGDATYSHGLALALADEVLMMNWETAKTACSNKNTSTPVTDATWLLASKEQWDYMIGEDGADGYENLRDGFNSVGGTNLEKFYYWSSTEDNDDSDLARIFRFDNDEWTFENKGTDDGVLTRACLAF
ncbi:MAG: hypothetical protein ILA23_05385, partial [Bacteroidales bacterium]|nr:hypothetical protein [Bacteroidales bacterium]